MKFVIIDDEPGVLLILRAMFKRAGHEVITYDNPVVCPIFMSECCPCSPVALCPDVIISDIDMPEVNGIEFVTRVIDKTCHCRKVALLSGRKISGVLVSLVSKTGIGYFEKPLDLNAFNEWLSQPWHNPARERLV